MPIRSNVLMFAAVLAAPAAAQTPAAPRGPQPIPRATFLQNMDSDFAKMDANHDGKLTKQEIEAFQHAQAEAAIMARNHQLFMELDRDHNGQLSPEEFAQFHATAPSPNATPMLQHFDTNHDGAITQIEFRAGTLANFDRLDTNKDGVVDAAEMKAGGISKR